MHRMESDKVQIQGKHHDTNKIRLRQRTIRPATFPAALQAAANKVIEERPKRSPNAGNLGHAEYALPWPSEKKTVRHPHRSKPSATDKRLYAG